MFAYIYSKKVLFCVPNVPINILSVRKRFFCNAIQYFVWHKRRILPLGHWWFERGWTKTCKVVLCEYGMMILHNMFFHNTLNQVFAPFLFKQSTSLVKAEESDTKKNHLTILTMPRRYFTEFFFRVHETNKSHKEKYSCHFLWIRNAFKERVMWICDRCLWRV